MSTEIEEDETILTFKGRSKGYDLLMAYNTLIDRIFLAWQYHFEMLNVGYVCYLNFIQFCRNYFPNISEQTISNMVKGFDSLLFKPEEKLRELAQKTIELSVEKEILNTDYEHALNVLEQSPRGRVWLQDFEESKDPWFYYSNGNGFYILEGSWVDDLNIPFQKIQDYISYIKNGQLEQRDLDKEANTRETLVKKYRALLLDSSLQSQFETLLQKARTVAVYLEDHNFYIENWLHTIFWKKLQQIGEIFAEEKFIENPSDLWFLNRWEVAQYLYELTSTWASKGNPRGPSYWQPIIQKRKKIFAILEQTPPQAAFGTPPEKIEEPLTVTLFGVNKDVVNKWFQKDAACENSNIIKGIGAVSGNVIGRAKVITHYNELCDLKDDDIIICQSLAPSWITYFKKARAVVANIGGIMSHTAILCREYNIPCVVGVTNATFFLKTGDMISVNGKDGIVEIYNS